MAITRRSFIQGALGAGAGLTLSGIEAGPAMAQASASQLERNKAVALRSSGAGHEGGRGCDARNLSPN
jgi:hypothetical protein